MTKPPVKTQFATSANLDASKSEFSAHGRDRGPGGGVGRQKPHNGHRLVDHFHRLLDLC